MTNKKALVIALAGGLLLSSVLSLKAQSNVFKINIIAPIVKTLNVQFERAINETSSLQIGFFYSGYNDDITKFNGFGITPEYRYYLTGEAAPDGVYIAPFIRYQSFNLEDATGTTTDEATFSAFGGGLIIGKQWIFKGKVALDIFLGPAYNSGSVEVKSGSSTYDTGAFDGFGLRTGVCLGLAF